MKCKFSENGEVCGETEMHIRHDWINVKNPQMHSHGFEPAEPVAATPGEKGEILKHITRPIVHEDIGPDVDYSDDEAPAVEPQKCVKCGEIKESPIHMTAGFKMRPDGHNFEAGTRPEMPPKFYVASRASIPERSAMWRDLRSQGWQITSSWIDEAGEGETEDFGELWQRIYREISESDALILFATEGDFPLKGALVEVGIALGMGKKVFACLPNVQLQGITFRPIGSWIKHPLVTIADLYMPAISYLLKSYPAASVQQEPRPRFCSWCGERLSEDHRCLQMVSVYPTLKSQPAAPRTQGRPQRPQMRRNR